jgi:hypothetical protein
MTIVTERIIKIINDKLPKKGAFTHLEEATGINARSWGHVYNRRTTTGIEHLEAIVKMFPEYAYWIVTGKTIPEAGQTSPDLEQLEELKKRIYG